MSVQQKLEHLFLVTVQRSPTNRELGLVKKITGDIAKADRDVLLRIIDRGRNPANLPLAEVMVSDPESVPNDATIAWVLNKMSVGGFRHVPVVDDEHRPAFVVSVRDVVEYLVEAFPREILTIPVDLPNAPQTAREGA